MAKYRFKLDDRIMHAAINLPKDGQLPLTINFDKNVFFGSAKVIIDQNGEMEIETDTEIPNISKLSFVVGGMVKEREDNIIKSFDLQEVSLISNL